MAPNLALMTRDDPNNVKIQYLIPTVITLVFGILAVFFAKCYMDARRHRGPIQRRRIAAASAGGLNQRTVNTFPIVQYDRGFADG